MKNIPEKIYIQVGDTERPEDFKTIEVSWCQDKIFENDITYLNKEQLLNWAIDKKEDSEGCIGDIYNMGYAKAISDLIEKIKHQ